MEMFRQIHIVSSLGNSYVKDTSLIFVFMHTFIIYYPGSM